MKRSFLKTMLKTALITFGLLLLIAGLLNPATFLFGLETTAVCDNVAFTPSGNETYLTEIDYHYYTSTGSEYSGSASFKGPDDPTISMTLHPVKYLPFLPFVSAFLTNYSIPLLSIIFIASGIILVASGIFIKTFKKEVPTSIPVKVGYICPACECEIDKDSIFCNYCGQKIIMKG